ncbi:MAG: AAA family ATPase [Oscillospiraceae bacterium]|nr:AAA family ATPase [Oscillospiraceae bacterium]
MPRKNDNLEELLCYIDPSALSYQEWCGIGMALKDAGYDVSTWDNWSRRDAARYHAGECAQKWNSFNGSDTPVTAGTIIHMALQNGYQPKQKAGNGTALDWNDEISDADYVVTSPGQTQALPIPEPSEWDPADQISRYIEALFEVDDYICYVTDSWQNDKGKYMPGNGCWDRTAGQLLAELKRYHGDFASVFGDVNSESGAWIRFNPMDGKGGKNENVTEHRYALVESDAISIEQQNGIMHDLQLPIAALVYSGGKSLHAIVRVDAGDAGEYRKRVDFLYSVCDKNGLKVDRNCRNPSRLSRMPGVMRNGKKQFLVETNTGFASWAEWKDYVESITDDLPDFETMSDAWENLPELAPPLIEGVLRQGHKMLIAGPSKAGKSYALIEMCVAIAEGRKWLSWQCAKGRVLYVNLELDRASCLHRFRDVYTALHIPPQNLSCIDIWNLRGVTEPMDKLAPKLIRRARKQNYIAVIIDPIYKVITGDENSADQMAHFCNQFDKVCTELGCAVIYCHHHSKGTQGGKRSMDRASGSGVFARDPDALLDMIELDLTEEIVKQMQNQYACRVCETHLSRNAPGALAEASQDDLLNRNAAVQICRDHFTNEQYAALQRELTASDAYCTQMTAWRLEGTLREFPKFPPVNLWFQYPVHEADHVGVLKDLQTDVELTSYQRGAKRGAQARQRSEKAKDADKNAELLNTFNLCNMNGDVTVQDMAEYLGVERRTVERRLKKCSQLVLENGKITRKSE